MKKPFVFLAVAVAVLAGPSAAQADITDSQVTTPSASPTFINPDEDLPSNPLTIAGTASGSGSVDLRCAYADGSATASGILASNVPVTGGTFSTDVSANSFFYYICRVIAVPAGNAGPWDVSVFRGPIVSNGSYDLSYVDTSGPDLGRRYDYYQASSALEGYWSVDSSGSCLVNDGYALSPETLRYEQIFGCSQIVQDESQAGALKIDGTNALLPYWQDASLTGKTAVANITNSIETTTGTMSTYSSEEAVTCTAPLPCATAYQGSGVKLEGGATGGTRGHTLARELRWVNTTSSAKQVTFAIDIANYANGWKFPGESAYSSHISGDSQSVPPGDIASFFLSEDGSDCGTLTSACGSVTWSIAPTAIAYRDAQHALLSYSMTIPANGSKTLGLTFSAGYPQSSVEAYAAAAEASYASKPPPEPPSSGFSLGKKKLNKKKGTATIPVQVSAAGVLEAKGKNLKSFRRSVSGPGTVEVKVQAAGKGKKKLKKKGKLKVNDRITFTATGSTAPVTKTVGVTLKAKKKQGGK